MSTITNDAKEAARHIQSNKHSCYTCGDVTAGDTSLCEECAAGWSQG